MPQPKLEKCSTKIYPYQSDFRLQLQGVTTLTKTQTVFKPSKTEIL